MKMCKSKNAREEEKGKWMRRFQSNEKHTSWGETKATVATAKVWVKSYKGNWPKVKRDWAGRSKLWPLQLRKQRTGRTRTLRERRHYGSSVVELSSVDVRPQNCPGHCA